MKVGDLVKYTYADGDVDFGVVVLIEALYRNGSFRVVQVRWTDGDVSTHNTSTLEAL
tara:strand:+ start:169 stop:339 length:171 start_codon:yes stop_codon:yes gene_type:complete